MAEAARGDGRAGAKRSPSSTTCCCERRATSGRRRAALPAAVRSTTSPCRPPTTRWWRCSRSSRLPRREPLHDVGLQVRATRGRREARRRAWQGREIVLEPESWPEIADGGPARTEHGERRALRAIRAPSASARRTSASVRRAGVARGADRRARGAPRQTRGALYKTLHDARPRLRRELAADRDLGRTHETR